MSNWTVSKPIDQFKTGDKFEFDGNVYTVSSLASMWGMVEVETNEGYDFSFLASQWFTVVQP